MERSLKHFKKNIQLILLVISLILYIRIGYFTDRTNFVEILSIFSLLFVGYFFLIRSNISFHLLLAFVIFFRLIFLLSVPNLSDDFYRFIWDGRLLFQGENPFLHLPSHYLQQGIPGINNTLFEQLNSPNYFTIYPPVCQFVYFVSAFGGDKSILYNVVIIRIFILLAELGTIYFLLQLTKKNEWNQKLVLTYAFNPLIIIELSGNVHPEAWMIFFLCLSLYFLLKNQLLLSPIFFGLAISSKLLPLMFLPFFITYLGWKKAISYYLITGLTCILLFLPFFNFEMIYNLSDSINLYFKKFEFNASIYYIVRWIGFQVKGYNIIQTAGIRLSFIPVILIALLTFNQRDKWENLWEKMLFALSAYFFVATIIHPWYITTLVFLSVPLKFRFAVLWSFLAILSYATYQTNQYIENLWLVALEYCLVYGWLIWELMVHKKLLFRGYKKHLEASIHLLKTKL
ncbi:hypothetical protein [Flexithrix dorotheae]|uniref:hypothetical protein n=1 Tax=Flexithrix dorotheae TaxID=70993 RepID=UPI000365E39D|nr:hypothetical protein [Flexithrix dorotheae]